MVEKIIIAGAGGQGIMLLGKVLAEAAMRESRRITWLPAYGAEVRGGTAHCMVIISDEEIGSPYIEKADTLVIMNGPSLRKFRGRIKSKGLLIINCSLVDNNEEKGKPYLSTHRPGSGARILRYPFTDIAIKLGNIKVANMVALGCLIAHKHIAGLQSVSAAMESIAPEDKKSLVDINQKALLAGAELIK